MKQSKLHVIGLLLITLCLLPTFCLAHHFKGLPHFSYFENYPQVPQDEFLDQEGEYEFSLVIYDFQGIQRDDALQPDDVRLYLVIYNLLQNKVYNGPLTLNIRDRDRIVYSETFASSQEESLYSLQSDLPIEGKYSLEVLFGEEKTAQANIAFVLSSQKIHWGKWVAGFMIFFVVIVAIGSRKARVARDRKDNSQARKNRSVTT